MEELKARLSTKGCKYNLQCTKAQQDYFVQECGFTEEEEVVFKLRARGCNITCVAFRLEETFGRYYSRSTVEARIRSIKAKMLEVL